MSRTFNKLIFFLTALVVFILPLFFLPITQEFYTIQKQYLLAAVMLVLLAICAVQLLVSKKVTWIKKPFDTAVTLFVVSVGLSILFSSPNKIQAMLNPTFGLVTIGTLAVFYFLISRQKNTNIYFTLLNISASILSVIALVMVFNPFAKMHLPNVLLFLKTVSFTPIGLHLDLLVFLGFVLVYNITHILYKKNNTKFSPSLIFFLIQLVGVTATVFSLIAHKTLGTITPFSISWYSAVETLKQPTTALFGYGIDNFSSIFTRTKDYLYNQSPMWEISAFGVSASTFLHVFTESGLLGAVSLVLILLSTVKTIKKTTVFLIGYMILAIAITPPSFILFFLFFFMLAYISSGSVYEEKETDVKTYDFSELPPAYIGITVGTFLFVGASFYALSQSYLAEVMFKESLNAASVNNLNDMYTKMRKSINYDPYIERFRLNFSQTNLLIANNIAAKTTQKDQSGKQITLSETERQTISQAIQAAISEAKAVVTLNPQKASGWENLANIYRNILSVAEGADAWTISAYQRAIILDPQNAKYRLDLGGVQYGLGNYSGAARSFEEAIALKSDWPNAHYNLAWTYYQQKEYQKAVAAMQTALSLINPSKDKPDYDKANKDLEEFKKLLPTPTPQQESSTPKKQDTQLALPTPVKDQVQPKIELPKEASPEAK